MKNLTKSIKKRYIIFMLTIGIIIISVVLIINRSINLQNTTTNNLNLSSKQGYLMERIERQVYYFSKNKDALSDVNELNKLKELSNELEVSRNYLYSKNIKEGNNRVIDSLFKVIEPDYNKILTSIRNIFNNKEESVVNTSLQTIWESEIPFFKTMDLIVNSYEKEASKKLQKLKYTIFFLGVIAALILLGEFMFVLVPAFNQLLKKHNELEQANKELAISENKIKENMLELTKLKTDLEIKDTYNKVFIEQAPTAIAMLDKDMKYIAVSQRWIKDYKMEGQEIIGRSHYDIFPEIGDDWKANHQKGLKGAIDVCDEAPFVRADGTVQWIYWDVRPWYISEGNIGGLIMHTGDITHLKEKEEERVQIEIILDKTNEVARIGAWEINLEKDRIFWSKMVREIHEVPENYEPDLETAINFFKEGESRNILEKVVGEAMEHGTPYDVEVELVTLKGNILWTRAMGQAEIVGGKCIRLFGVFQDINDKKLSQLALNKAHTELKAIFNSGAVSIVATEVDGIISHFNHGAEILTGYSASEMIGLQRPTFFHLREELDKFRIDIAKQYNKNPIGFSAQEELSKHNAYDTREWTYKRKDGSTIPVQLTLTSIKDDQGELIGFLGISTDISEKRIAQDELLRKNQLLNFAEEITLMGNWQWDTVTDKVKWSNNLYNIFKLDKRIDNLKFDTYFNFVHPEDKDIVADYFNKTVEEKSLNRFTHRIITGDGELKFIQLLGEVITNSKGEVIEMIGTCQDITASKVSEKELHDAHVQLQAIFNSGPIGIVTTDIKGVINYFNRGAEILTGYSASEMMRLQTPFIYHTEEELDKFKSDIAKQYDKNPIGFHPQLELSKNNAYDTREWTYIRKDGSTLPVQLTLTGIKDEQGKDIGFLGVSIDVSERRKSENELLRNNKLLNFAEELTMMGNWQVDLVNNSEKWSKNLYHIFGLEENTEITRNTFISFVHPEDKERVAKHVEKSIKDKNFNDLMFRIKLKNGTIKTLLNLAEIVVDTMGNVIELVGTCQDVTQQRMAEKKFRGLLESAPDAMVIVNERRQIQLINKQAEILFGYSAEELFEKRVDILIPKRFSSTDPRTKVMGEAKESIAINKNGKEIPVQISFSPLQTEEGLLVSAAIRDITEQKLAENELLRKNQLLSFAEKITMMGNWQLDLVTNNMKWSANLYQIFGLEENTKLTFDTYLSFVHSEDIEKIIKHKEVAFRDKKFDNLIHRIKLKDGTVKTIQLLAEVITDTSGRIIEVIGTCQDVTAQKMAENKFRGLLESAPDAMVIVNEKGKIQLINKQAEKLFGYSLEELFGNSVEILIPKGFSVTHSVDDNGFFFNPKTIGIGEGKELFGINKKGKEIPIQISLSPLQTEEGLLVSAAIRDITIQKLAENELLRKNQLLSFAEKITMMGNWQMDAFTSTIQWSANLYKIFRIEEKTELNFDVYLSFVHPEDLEKVIKHREASIKDKKFTDLMHRVKLRDGTVKMIQLLAEVITDNLGNVIELIGTCQDVTAQKMAENKFRGLLESAPDAMVIVNEKGKIQLINKQAEKLFGYSLEELFEKSVEILIPGRFIGNHKAHRDGFFSNPKTRGMGDGKELFGINKSGHEIPIQISLSPLQTEEGLLVSAAIRDITTQKLAARKIIESKESLEVLANKLTVQNTQLADFAHITSHNLRAPVSNLNSLLGFYNTSENEEDKASLFKKFEKVINHLTQTLNTLVAAIKTKNETSQNLEEITFDEVLIKTKEILSGEILKSGIIITSDFSKIKKVSYNKVYLESIFLNLVGNAIKYRSDGRLPELFIESEIEKGKIKLKFKDNGMGIDLKRHGSKLFGLNKVFHRHPDAKGVGLFMTKMQIEAMGGKISATSEVNIGSTFNINFN
ncbi:PAS domain S-box protein [Mariniflexile litorale]|uniref:histidine kinase n=1 Tax=Mariniflexile litorale TaxID=3045158 RepID=A0AAU7ECR1_9FLAO|nr:PAS domain S-box protein [Mariniflexile sp. KMM 9835]MDQ8212107.1 PAS domain S-box protein [Mariniflexile sp. KMM 9835]